MSSADQPAKITLHYRDADGVEKVAELEAEPLRFMGLDAAAPGSRDLTTITLRTQDQAEINSALVITPELLQDHMAGATLALQALIEEFAMVFADEMVATIRAISRQIDAMLPPLAALWPIPMADVDAGIERCFRRYAAHYNARHPARKISHRRLDRHQRQLAIIRYAHERN